MNRNLKILKINIKEVENRKTVGQSNPQNPGKMKQHRQNICQFNKKNKGEKVHIYRIRNNNK